MSAADLCLALALSALLSVVVAAAQYMRAEKAEAEVARLTAERDALAQIKRHIDEVRNGTGWTVQIYGVLLQQCDQYGKTIDTRRAERAEAERDALAAQVARVEALAEDWRYKGQFGWGPWQIGEGPDPEGYVMDHCASALRAALSGSETDTTGTQPTDQEDK